MYFTFQESADTRDEDIEEMKRWHKEYISSDDAVEMGDVETVDGTFAIYEVYEADIELDEDDDYLWSGKVVEGTAKIVGVYVCASRERAGWIEEKSYYKDVKNFNYREK